MIKIICDKCGCDCGANAMVMTTEVIYNPSPLDLHDLSSINIIVDHTTMRYVLCTACYQALHLPNPYSSKDELDWDDEERSNYND